VPVGEVVPEALQRDRRLGLAVGPQQRDHLAVDAHAPVGGPGALEHRADDVLEPPRVGHSVDRDAREQARRVEGHVAIGVDRVLDVEPGAAQRRLEGTAVRGGGDDDRRATVVQSGAHEVRDRVAQKPFGLVELDDVLVRSGAGPASRVGRCRSGSV
jgi:hypothetical protein